MAKNLHNELTHQDWMALIDFLLGNVKKLCFCYYSPFKFFVKILMKNPVIRDTYI